MRTNNEGGGRRAEGRFCCALPAACCLVLLIATVAFPAEKVDLVVTGGTVITMDAARHVFADGAVAIRGNHIVGVGLSREIGDKFKAGRTISARGKIVLPGLINTHNHAPMVLLRGIADDLKLMDWLQNYIFPAEAKNVTADFAKWGTELACLEMIRSGTTTYADMYYFEDQVAQATAEAGIRGVLGETIIQFPSPDSKTPGDALAYAEAFIKKWKGHSLITPAVAPHAPYTNTADSLKASKALADKYGVPFLTHVAETQDEVNQIRQQQGLTSTQWLEKLGVLGPNVVFAHGVWLSDEDLSIVKTLGVGIAHNPESNMKLASGTAPVPKMLSLGIKVGLGTDGAASNNNLDMFEAMDFAAKLHKLSTMDPTVLAASQVLEMATMGGARVLGLDSSIGSLEQGKLADLIVVDAGGPHAQPIYNPYSQIVYDLKGGDVSTTIVNGKIVMRDRRILTLNETQVLAKAEEYRRRIISTLKN
jgi:5-methylthioadenosine/S-adenosylhomocysteine deaminase